mgnify:CR=1 FL=1
MLSQNQMVRKVIESTYIGKCTVIEHKKTVNANHTTSLNDEIVYKDVPCRLSFKILRLKAIRLMLLRR